jgi:hypothetical protein
VGRKIRNPNVEIRNKSKKSNLKIQNGDAGNKQKGITKARQHESMKKSSPTSEKLGMNHGIFRVFVLSGFRDYLTAGRYGHLNFIS